MKFKIFICFLISSICCSAADNPWLKTSLEKAMKKPQCMIELDKSTYINNLETFKKFVEKGSTDGKPISTGQLAMFSMIVVQWCKDYKYIELDTGLSKTWLKKISKIFDALSLYCKTMDNAQKVNNTKLYDAAKEKYKQYYKLLVKTLKNPERAKRRVRDALQIQKVKEYKAYRKYLEKQEEIEKADPR